MRLRLASRPEGLLEAVRASPRRPGRRSRVARLGRTRSWSCPGRPQSGRASSTPCGPWASRCGASPPTRAPGRALPGAGRRVGEGPPRGGGDTMRRRSRRPAARGRLALTVACGGGAPEPAALDTRNEQCASAGWPSPAPLRRADRGAGRLPRFFDDLGCLARLPEGGQGPADATAFVTDHRTKAWVRADRAVYSRVPGSRRRWARTSSPTPTSLPGTRPRRGAGQADSATDFRAGVGADPPALRTWLTGGVCDALPPPPGPSGRGMKLLALCARQELVLALRSRWTQIFAVVFGGLALGWPGPATCSPAATACRTSRAPPSR